MRALLHQLFLLNEEVKKHPMLPGNVREMLNLQQLLFLDIVNALEELTPAINDNAAANSNSGPPYHCAVCGCIALRACARRNCGYGR